jgi:hypothetical protein
VFLLDNAQSDDGDGISDNFLPDARTIFHHDCIVKAPFYFLLEKHLVHILRFDTNRFKLLPFEVLVVLLLIFNCKFKFEISVLASVDPETEEVASCLVKVPDVLASHYADIGDLRFLCIFLLILCHKPFDFSELVRSAVEFGDYGSDRSAFGVKIHEEMCHDVGSFLNDSVFGSDQFIAFLKNLQGCEMLVFLHLFAVSSSLISLLPDAFLEGSEMFNAVGLEIIEAGFG